MKTRTKVIGWIWLIGGLFCTVKIIYDSINMSLGINLGAILFWTFPALGGIALLRRKPVGWWLTIITSSLFFVYGGLGYWMFASSRCFIYKTESLICLFVGLFSLITIILLLTDTPSSWRKSDGS